jgi:hypothetical protein
MPQDWNIGHLIKLSKKGNLKECKNYRGIALLSVDAKVLNRILPTILLKAVDEKLTEQQAGFGKDRACTDQIAALRIIIKQSLESTKLRNKEVFHLLISQLCRLRERF